MYKVTKTQCVKDILKATFPDYKGRKIKKHIQDGPIDLRSCMDGGTFTKFAVLDLDSMKVMHVPKQHPVFDKQIQGLEAYHIQPRNVVVAWHFFCGKDCGITIYTDLTQDSLPASFTHGKEIPKSVGMFVDK